MLAGPFLTALDSRLAIKGSMDPLGVQTIWTYLGRQVVGNLTTVSNSTSSFTVLLVGCYLAERVAESSGANEIESFLKWEQLAAYTRAHLLKQTSFRGSIRTQKFLAESTRVVLSTDPARQILGNQKTYGILGLYSSPAKASGLLEQDQFRLTPAARELIERRMLPLLSVAAGSDARKLVVRLAERSVRVDLDGRDKGLVAAVATLLGAHKQPGIREFYRHHLVFGGPHDRTHGRQRELASAFAVTFGDGEYALGPRVVDELIQRAQAASHVELATRLAAIRTCESALAPLAAIFSFALQRDGMRASSVANELARTWGSRVATVDAEGLAQLDAELRAACRDESAARRFVHAASQLRAGDYEGVLRLLLTQNAWVMQSRGGAAWLEERGGKLRVRLRYDEGGLPAREQLPRLWRHAYFLDSVRAIGREVGVA